MCRSKRRQTAISRMINPWGQTEDEGQRSMRLFAAAVHSQVGGNCAYSLNPSCGADAGCEKAVKYVWLALGVFNSPCLFHMCSSVLAAEEK